MPDYNEMARRSVRVWMRQVLETKGWTANEWAKAAGTSPTNITRLLNSQTATVPTAATLMKLAIVARTQPNLMGGAALAQAPPEKRVNFCPSCGEDLRSPGHEGTDLDERIVGGSGV